MSRINKKLYLYLYFVFVFESQLHLFDWAPYEHSVPTEKTFERLGCMRGQRQEARNRLRACCEPGPDTASG